MKWEEIVKIQYDAMKRSSLIYIAILSAIAAFQKNFELSEYTKAVLFISFALVLLQSIAILYLTNIQRQISWTKDMGGDDDLNKNKQENDVRRLVFILSVLTTIFVLLTIFLLVFFAKKDTEQCHPYQKTEGNPVVFCKER